MRNKRYGYIAALLNMLSPGAGFLYAGSWQLALLTFFLLFSTIVFIGGSRFILSSKGLLSLFIVIVFIYLVSTLAAFFFARKMNHLGAKVDIKKGQHWLLYMFFIVVSVSCAIWLFTYRTSFLGYSVYLLPSKSMASTLLPRDYIMVDTWIYQQDEPKKGDIVTFRYALKPQSLFIKRIVATEGDWVKIEGGQLIVNERIQYEPYVLAINNIKTTRKRYQEWIVPKGHYFVLGDNRDSSNDSRYWGFLEQDAIQGKAMSIWFSYTTNDGFRIRKNRIQSLY